MAWPSLKSQRVALKENYETLSWGLRMINTQALAPRTQEVFRLLATDSRLKSFTLVGGTALALQINHRQSEDLDFWLADAELNKLLLNDLVNSLRAGGHTVQLITPAANITRAKINGIDLLRYAQDYVIDSVKITFFARIDGPYRFFNTFERLRDSALSFSVMGQDGLFAMKSHLLSQRARSRDLFDLQTLIAEQGYRLEDVLEAGVQADAAFSKEYAKSVLVGDTPLDQEDEGFASIGLKTSLQSIYEFFTEHVNQYERALAKQLKQGSAPK
jgi:hypothetical protein